jgi:hypothetical protein
MSLNAKSTGGGSIDPGTQYNDFYKKWTRKVIIQWELPDVRAQYERDDGTKVDNPRVITREYGLTLHKKATLRADLVAWRGREFTDAELAGFDLFNILGVPAEIQVVHKTKGEKTYANVSGVSKPFKGVAIPDAELEPKKFSFDIIETLEQAQGQLIGIAEWIGDKIQDAKEYKALEDRASGNVPPAEQPQMPEDDDEIPF